MVAKKKGRGRIVASSGGRRPSITLSREDATLVLRLLRRKACFESARGRAPTIDRSWRKPRSQKSKGSSSKKLGFQRSKGSSSKKAAKGREVLYWQGSTQSIVTAKAVREARRARSREKAERYRKLADKLERKIRAWDKS